MTDNKLIIYTKFMDNELHNNGERKRDPPWRWEKDQDIRSVCTALSYGRIRGVWSHRVRISYRCVRPIHTFQLHRYFRRVLRIK